MLTSAAESNCLLIDVYRDPIIARQLSMGQWELVLRQARAANVLPRMAHLFKGADLWLHIPQQIQSHLQSAIVTSDAAARSIRWEVHNIINALTALGTPFVFLKGTAYLLAALPASEGRIFSDIDFIVPKSNIEKVEKALLAHGWVPTHLNKYDQRYYRQWMHEIPPLKHTVRKSVLDVHHAILPETARLQTDSAKLLEGAVLAENVLASCKVLAPTDMVLHSATHLFSDGEFEQGLRDLMDLDLLFKTFGKIPGYWDQLVLRATELNLTLPLFYAIRYTTMVLNTPIPEEVIKQVNDLYGSRWRNSIMDQLMIPALRPNHKSCRVILNGLIRWLLYVRGHYLRMPFYLLIPHLIRKAVANDKK